MLFYTLLILTSLALVVLSLYLNKKTRLTVCIVVSSILGIIASIRGYVGTDTYAYHRQFNVINDIEVSYFDASIKYFIVEPVFMLLAKLVYFVNGDSFSYLACIGVLQTILLILIIRKLENPSLFLIFYIPSIYINNHFNILRASTALLLILLSMIYINEGGIKFYLTLLASVLCHYTAIIIVVYVLLYKKLKDKRYISSIALMFILVLCIMVITTMLSDLILVKYGKYALDDFKIQDSSFGFGLLLQLLLYLCIGISLYKTNLSAAIFFVVPAILLKYLTLHLSLVGRIESFILPMLILLVANTKKSDAQRLFAYSSYLIIMLSLINAFGVLAELSKTDMQALDSPYIPYHTFIGID